jgi:hypothetical protein
VPKKRKSRKKKGGLETHSKGKADTYALLKGKRWYFGVTKRGKHALFTDAETKRAIKRAKKIRG